MAAAHFDVLSRVPVTRRPPSTLPVVHGRRRCRTRGAAAPLAASTTSLAEPRRWPLKTQNTTTDNIDSDSKETHTVQCFVLESFSSLSRPISIGVPLVHPVLFFLSPLSVLLSRYRHIHTYVPIGGARVHTNYQPTYKQTSFPLSWKPPPPLSPPPPPLPSRHLQGESSVHFPFSTLFRPLTPH